MATRIPAAAKWLIGGATAHTVAETFYDLAMPLLILAYTGSALLMALMFIVGFGAELLVALVGGGLVDRFDRKVLLRVVVFSEVLVMGGAAVGAYTNTLGGVALIGIAGSFDFLVRLYAVADAAALPELVSGDALIRANGVMQSFSSSAQLLGPLAAGVLLTADTDGAYLFLVTATLLAVLAAAQQIVHWPVNRQPVGASILSIAKSGLRLTFYNIDLRRLALWRGLLDFALGASMLMVIYYLSQVLRLPPWQVGASAACMAAGGLLGGLIFASVHRTLHSKVLLRVSTGGIACSFVLFAVSHTWYAAGASLALMAFLLALLSRSIRVFLQSVVPPAWVGRVAATSQLIATVVGPVGVGVAAITAEFLDVRLVFLISALILVGLCGSTFTVIGVGGTDWRDITPMQERDLKREH